MVQFRRFDRETQAYLPHQPAREALKLIGYDFLSMVFIFLRI
jgi:hypothetical protein